MNGKLIKIATGLGTAVSALYWLATPALAIDLCADTQGLKVSGLCGVKVDTLVSTAINTVLFVAFIAALIYLIIGGIRWIMSGGDKEGTTKAKESVTAALIGLAVVLGSWILINIILNFFGSPEGLKTLTTPKLVP